MCVSTYTTASCQSKTASAAVFAEHTAGQHLTPVKACQDSLLCMAQVSEQQQFLVRASFLEIYNEEVRDLLSKNPKNKLDLKERKDQGVYVKGLNSFVVKSVAEITSVLEVSVHCSSSVSRCLSVCPFVCLPVSVCLCLSVRPSVCLSVCVSAVWLHTAGKVWLLDCIVTHVLLSYNNALTGTFEKKLWGQAMSRRHAQQLKQSVMHLKAFLLRSGGEEEQERRSHADEPRLQSLTLHLYHHS